MFLRKDISARGGVEQDVFVTYVPVLGISTYGDTRDDASWENVDVQIDPA